MPPTQCPQCGDRVAAGADFCVNGHYVGWDSTQVGMPPVPAKPPTAPGPGPGGPGPGGPAGMTYGQQFSAEPNIAGAHTPLAPQGPQAPRQNVREDIAANPTPTGPTRTCLNCGELNPLDRTYCQRCGERLDTQVPEPVYLPPPPTQQGRFPAKLVVTIVLALALIAAGVVFALSRNGNPKPAAAKPSSTVDATQATSTPPSSAPPSSEPATSQAGTPRPVKVDRSTMTAEATSELPPDQQLGRSYRVENVLDGNDATAWNSDGDKVGDGVGQVLTFHFASPVHLIRLDFVNGYARNQMLFRQNGRVQGVEITTDSGTVQDQLADRPIVQSLKHDYGTTSFVRIKVLSIYPGTTYKDLAVSEVGFLQLVGG